jgi:type III secretion protein L
MAVWFRHGPCTVGVDDGVIRAGDFAALMSLLQAAEQVESRAQQLLAAAQAQADELLSAAQARADALQAQAQSLREQGYEEGLKQGIDQAAAEWAAQALTGARDAQAVLERRRERLGGIVATAVERLVEQEDKQALFRKALRTIGKLVKDVPMMTLRVHSDDRDAAQQALLAIVDPLGSSVPIEVVSDAGVAGGSCRFESDEGVIDASLSTQLAAIKRAVVRAATAEPVGDEV